MSKPFIRSANARKHANRQAAFQQDFPHLVRIVRRVAQNAKRRNGTFSSDNVEHAVTHGAMLPAFDTREYRSGLLGKAIQEAARLGFIKACGTTRNRYRSLVVKWRAA